MTRFSVRPFGSTARAGALLLPVFAGDTRLRPLSVRLDKRAGGSGARVLAEGFSGKRGETRVVSVERAGKLVHFVLVGMGDARRANVEEIADAFGAGARALVGARAESGVVALDDIVAASSMDAAAVVHAAVKGASLARYSYAVGRRRGTALKNLTFVSSATPRSLAPAVERARLLADLIARVRDWVNTPANHLTPSSFAAQARAVLVEHGAECRVWNGREIAKAGMGGLSAVGRGGSEEPRFLVAHHRVGDKRLPLVCLVGKGVTFDSGGISIKPWEKMHEMKSDMAGGASVVAAVAAAARLDLPLRVAGLVPCVENMPDGNAFRPGDVLTLHSGKTVEVLSTDAEGRLILADAVSYAREHYRPDVIVDMATLTGGMVVALGTRVAGMMGNSERDLEDLRGAALDAGEPVWELPIDDYFIAAIKGDVSDYKNYGGRAASPITGGAMIGVFAQGTPWVHIDIAGTSWNDGGGPSYQTRGGTGYGVDLLLRFLEMVAARR